MSDCIFCKIASGTIPSATVYEDEDFLKNTAKRCFTCRDLTEDLEPFVDNWLDNGFEFDADAVYEKVQRLMRNE